MLGAPARARKTLVEKYGVALKDPVIVEVFPQQKEFAVRTFGLPGAEGLLGVCFGRVVTARSPASQGEHPSNWEAVLWHEFCHVVTLGKTRNKMPRWLSEGISVYEEGQEDRTWATAFDPRYRVLILSDGLKPLSSLSSAFLTATTPLDVQFAYFESALAVEFLIERFGLPTLKGLLDDLGAGMALNEVLPIRTKMTLDQIDGEFARFARERPRESRRARPGKSRTYPWTQIHRSSRPGSISIPRAFGDRSDLGHAWLSRESGRKPRKYSKSSRRFIPNTSDPRMLTCCWPPYTNNSPIPPPNERSSRNWQ